jgi:hypothetical protein
MEMRTREHNGRVLAASTGRAPAITGTGPSHYPQDLLALALSDSDAIEAMRLGRYDVGRDAPVTDPASLYGASLGEGYFQDPVEHRRYLDRRRYWRRKSEQEA